jgi:chromosome segregation ATPase
MAKRVAAVSMAIRYAEEQIDAATRRLAEIDRELANLQRQTRGSTLSWPALKEIREQAAIVRRERDAVCRELAELIALAEMPLEMMGTA